MSMSIIMWWIINKARVLQKCLVHSVLLLVKCKATFYPHFVESKVPVKAVSWGVGDTETSRVPRTAAVSRDQLCAAQGKTWEREHSGRGRGRIKAHLKPCQWSV